MYLISETFTPAVSVVMEVKPKWSPRKYSSLSYAKAHDQTVADDYFAAMQRVEQRLEIVPAQEKEKTNEDVKLRLVQIIKQLELSELGIEERILLAIHLNDNEDIR
ncbi:MAG TPA: hypothetical protein PKI33_05060 [Anaerolineales bacterium]|nr:hypothetical protein [Anaerolineales bacterium]